MDTWTDEALAAVGLGKTRSMEGCLKWGTLYKTGKGKLGAKWQPRHFELWAGELRYYKSHEDITPAGVIQLAAGSTLGDKCLGPSKSSQDLELSTFSIIPHNQTRVFNIGCDEADQLQEWKQKIQKEIGTIARRFEGGGGQRISLFEGYMWKKGESKMGKSSKWQRRYFVLFPSQLEYYATKEDAKPAGTIKLTVGAFLEAKQNMTKSHDDFEALFFSFDLCPVPDSKKKSWGGTKRVYHMAVTESSRRDQWLNVIRNQIPDSTESVSGKLDAGLLEEDGDHKQKRIHAKVLMTGDTIFDGFLSKKNKLNRWKKLLFVITNDKLEWFASEATRQAKKSAGEFVWQDIDSVAEKKKAEFFHAPDRFQ